MSACALPEWPDGKIDLDSAIGNALGFTSAKFDGWLWKTDDQITISFIESIQAGKGNLSKLFDAIEAIGFKVAVPTPMHDMREILIRKGFMPHIEMDAELGPVELWTKE